MKLWGPLAIGAAGMGIMFVLLAPRGCYSTAQGIPPGGPDPNEAGCSSYLFDNPSWGATPGGEPGTDEEFESFDLVKRRMVERAVLVGAIPLVVGVAAAWILHRRTSERNTAAD